MSSWRMGILTIANYFFLRRPAKPSSAEPNNHAAAGTGTGLAVIAKASYDL